MTVLCSIVGSLVGISVALLLFDIIPYLRAEKARRCKHCLWYVRATGFCIKHFQEDIEPFSTCEKWKNGKISIVGGKK